MILVVGLPVVVAMSLLGKGVLEWGWIAFAAVFF